MKKLLLVTIAIMILLVSNVLAGDLIVDDVRVEVDGDKEGKANELGGTIEVEPGDKVEYEIELENTFDRDEDIEIEDIEIIITIYDIDDGDDIEVEAEEFDIKEDDNEETTLEFSIPWKVEEDIYEMEVEITAEDSNGTDYEIILDYDLEVDKERHNLIVRRIEMAPEKAECQELVQFDFTILNIGTEDEDDVKIEVISNGLNYYFTENYDFESDPDDDEAEYNKRLDIDVSNARQGIYEIEVKARYGSSRSVSESKALTVIECKKEEPAPEPKPEPKEEPKEEPKQEETTFTSTSTSQPTQADVVFNYAQPSQPKYVAMESKKSGWEENKWLYVVIITDIVLVIAGVLIYLAFRKK